MEYPLSPNREIDSCIFNHVCNDLLFHPRFVGFCNQILANSAMTPRFVAKPLKARLAKDNHEGRISIWMVKKKVATLFL